MIVGIHGDAVVNGVAEAEETRYRHAKAAGVFKAIPLTSSFRIEDVIQRIHRNQETFQERFERKIRAERTQEQK